MSKHSTTVSHESAPRRDSFYDFPIIDIGLAKEDWEQVMTLKTDGAEIGFGFAPEGLLGWSDKMGWHTVFKLSPRESVEFCLMLKLAAEASLDPAQEGGGFQRWLRLIWGVMQ